VKALIDQAADLADHEAGQVEQQLRATLAEAGLRVEAAPEPPHEELVRRAINRTRPFDDKGSGYRDALHWHFFLHTVEQAWDAQDLVFVSGDRTAFGDGNSSRFHPDLERDVRDIGVDVTDVGEPMHVTWARRFADVNIPGEFDTEAVDLRSIVSFEEIGSYLASSLLGDEPIEVDPFNTPFGAAVVGAMITDLTDPVVTHAEARSYYEKDRLAIDVVVEMTATYLGFGVDDSDELLATVRNLSATGDVRYEGRVDYDPYARQFGESNVRLLNQSQWEPEVEMTS
jgi:hypothetical protein